MNQIYSNLRVLVRDCLIAETYESKYFFINCYFDQVSFRSNVVSIKCHFDQMSFRSSVDQSTLAAPEEVQMY